MTVFLDYIEKSANRECPGGLMACTDMMTNERPCYDVIYDIFLEKNASSNQIMHKNISSFIFIVIISLIQNLFHLTDSK